ncbi:MAG: carboxypeptidase-like regulatory domain-containing protein, partial [Ferruginibacter sp.]
MNLKKLLPLLIALFAMSFYGNAQVTTSSISGFVKSDKGVALEGATITAIHEPSGTKYVTVSKKDGNYTLPNTRIGGPYTLTVGYVGYTTQTTNNISLTLGEPYNADVTLSTNVSELSTVVVTASGKTGARSKT